MKTALVISLNFNPGHVSHLVAQYKQCVELGYESKLYVHQSFANFLPTNISIMFYGKDQLCFKDIKVAFFLFPCQYNLPLMCRLKLNHTKIIYTFHEPMESLIKYYKAGFGTRKLAKIWLGNLVNIMTVWLSDSILLPSRRALELYKSHKYYCNTQFHYLPLMYDDERLVSHDSPKRIYFSYIGTIAADHSFDEFVSFVEDAIRTNYLPNIRFLIATKSSLVDYDKIKKIETSDRVIIISGHSLSNEEINNYYAVSYVIWNAYARTTQSGVLAKSFMFGTPAIVLRKNLSEFTIDNHEVVAIDDNHSSEQIGCAVMAIVNNFSTHSAFCRQRFLTDFYYQNYNIIIQDILSLVSH